MLHNYHVASYFTVDLLQVSLSLSYSIDPPVFICIDLAQCK